MKSLALSNPSFRYLETGFKEWLDILGYAPTTVYYAPLHVRELLYYLEGKGITHIKALDSKHIRGHYERLRERANKKRGGALSNSHLNKHIQAIKRFTDYLRQVGRLELAASPLRNEKANEGRITVLSGEEIDLLFKATYAADDYLSHEKAAHLQSRDRAMLAVFYGCGLRRNEGVHLEVSEINFDKAILHVRRGKNYKERFVPISKASLRYLQEYVYDHRRELLGDGKSDAFFVSQRATRMQGQSLLLRLKHLQYRTENQDLIEKEIGLHTLRHSIATHLLQEGMKLESISRFLGHSSLESTQIYTHLIGEPCLSGRQAQEQKFNGIPRHEKVQLHEDEF
jgi:integrase/recombinase XerD